MFKINKASIFFIGKCNTARLPYSFLSKNTEIPCDVPINENQKSCLDLIFKECEETKFFENLSTVECDRWPIILLVSGHHRLPIPIHFLKPFWQKDL